MSLLRQNDVASFNVKKTLSLRYKSAGTGIFYGNHLASWSRGTHIWVGSLIIIGSDNGLSPDRRQFVIWTNAAILIIRTLGIHFIEIFIKIHTFWLKKMHLNMSSVKWRPFCLGLNVLKRDCNVKATSSFIDLCLCNTKIYWTNSRVIKYFRHRDANESL